MTASDLPARRILLIGAGGQLGRALASSLPPVGQVITTFRPGSEPLDGVSLDPTDPVAVRACVAAIRPALVVNAVAYTKVDQAEDEPEAARRLNADLPGVLAESCRTAGAGLVHFSTDYIYDGGGSSPRQEDDGIGPLGEYGRSKLAGETAIRAVGVPHLILRVQWLYAAWGQNFVRTMLRLAGREELRVVADQFGAPTSTPALARALAELLRGVPNWAEDFAARGGAYHLACDGETHWASFAEEIFAALATARPGTRVPRIVPIRSDEYAAKAVRPKNSRLDCGRFRETFGISMPSWRADFTGIFPEILAASEG